MTAPLTLPALAFSMEDVRAKGLQWVIDSLCLDVEVQVRKLLPEIEAYETLPSGARAPWEVNDGRA